MLNRFNLTKVFIPFILICCVNISYGQRYASIYLENGDRYTGRWLGADENVVRIEVHNQKLSIPFSQVKRLVPVRDLRLVPDAAAEKHLRNGEDLLDLGLREEAKQRFLAAIEEFPKYAEAHYKLGLLLQEEGKTDEALKYFGHVATINPEAYNMAEQFKQAGDAYLAAEEYRKAVDAYLLLFDRYPNHQEAEDAVYTAGVLLAEQLEATEEGLRTLQEATARFPDSGRAEKAAYLIGSLQSKAGLSEAAVQTLTAFILNHPDSEWLEAAYLARGNAYLQLKLNKDAIADFLFVLEHTSDGKLRREARKKRDESVWTVYTVSDGLPSNQIQAIAVDGETLWIGTPRGLTQIDVSMESWQPRSDVADYINILFDEPVDVRALAVDEQELWIGTLNHGAIRYNKLTEIVENYSAPRELPHKTVYDIEIHTDEVWMGTFSGVARYHRGTGQWTTYNKRNDSLPADDIVALAVTPKTVWIGTSASGMAVYDRELDYWRDFGAYDLPDLTPDSTIVSFDASQDELFFTWYNKEKNGYGAINLNDFTGRVQDVIWYGIVPLENIYVAVSEVAAETEGRPVMWLATNDGVIKHAQAYDHIEFPTDRLSDPTVSCIVLGEGAAWIGTANNGIAKIDTSALVLQQGY